MNDALMVEGRTLSTRSLALIGLLLMGAFVAHGSTIRSGSVNEEYVFGDAARDIQEGRFDRFGHFFRYQANSLGMSAIAAGVSSVVGQEASVTMVRAIVLVGSLIAIGATCLIFSATGLKGTPTLWSLVVLVNPLVWCTLSYGTADLLPAMLVTFGVLLVIRNRDKKSYSTTAEFATIGLLFALASGLKVHALFFAVVAGLMRFNVARLRKSIAEAGLLSLPSAITVAAYGSWTQEQFGFFLVPQHFSQAHFGGWAWKVPFTLALYVAFIGFTLGPVGLASASRRWGHPLSILLGAIIAFVAARASTENLGEMNFGALTSVMPVWCIQTLFFVGGWLGAAALVTMVIKAFAHDASTDSGPGQRWLIVMAIVYVLAISCSRPAQRYVMFVFPILVALALDSLAGRESVVRRQVAVCLTLIGFVPLCLAGHWFLASQGNAAKQMADQAIAQGIQCATDFTLIRQHVGDRTRWCGEINTPYRYEIVGSASEHSLAESTINLIGKRVRTYSLVEIASVDQTLTEPDSLAK